MTEQRAMLCGPIASMVIGNGGARWIWSRNLVLDNVVVARKTVR